MKKGFTLIEVLVVIAIIGILATVVVQNIPRPKADADAKPKKVAVDTSSKEIEEEPTPATWCPQFEEKYRDRKYLEISALCFDYFGITDEMVQREIERMELSTNPCNN